MDALLSLLDFEFVREIFSVEMAKITIAFVLAERLHSRTMKKNMDGLRDAINHGAEVMGRRLDGLEDRVELLEQKK